MIADFHFIRPYYLALLVPIIGIGWLLLRGLDERRVWKGLIAPHLLDQLMVNNQRQKRVRPVHLLLVVWVLAVIGLSGPTWRMEASPFAEDTAQMMVVLKVTPSMMAEDIQPTRLERAKQKLLDLLEERAGGATGLIVYSGSAHLVMPPTRDGRIIAVMAEGLLPETMPSEGDALADALRMADDVLKKSGQAGSVVVMADQVAGGAPVPKASLSSPVQFLSFNAYGSSVESGLESAARRWGARVLSVTVDSSDVESLARRAESSVQAVAAMNGGERWKDSGYSMVPLVVLLSLAWSRRGWKI